MADVDMALSAVSGNESEEELLDSGGILGLFEPLPVDDSKVCVSLKTAAAMDVDATDDYKTASDAPLHNAVLRQPVAAKREEAIELDMDQKDSSEEVLDVGVVVVTKTDATKEVVAVHSSANEMDVDGNNDVNENDEILQQNAFSLELAQPIILETSDVFNADCLGFTPLEVEMSEPMADESSQKKETEKGIMQVESERKSERQMEEGIEVKAHKSDNNANDAFAMKQPSPVLVTTSVVNDDSIVTTVAVSKSLAVDSSHNSAQRSEQMTDTSTSLLPKKTDTQIRTFAQKTLETMPTPTMAQTKSDSQMKMKCDENEIVSQSTAEQCSEKSTGDNIIFDATIASEPSRESLTVPMAVDSTTIHDADDCSQMPATVTVATEMRVVEPIFTDVSRMGEWTTEDCCQYLTHRLSKFGSRYTAAARRIALTGEKLLSMTDCRLQQELGVDRVLHRVRILRDTVDAKRPTEQLDKIQDIAKTDGGDTLSRFLRFSATDVQKLVSGSDCLLPMVKKAILSDAQLDGCALMNVNPMFLKNVRVFAEDKDKDEGGDDRQHSAAGSSSLATQMQMASDSTLASGSTVDCTSEVKDNGSGNGNGYGYGSGVRQGEEGAIGSAEKKQEPADGGELKYFEFGEKHLENLFEFVWEIRALHDANALRRPRMARFVKAIEEVWAQRENREEAGYKLLPQHLIDPRAEAVKYPFHALFNPYGYRQSAAKTPELPETAEVREWNTEDCLQWLAHVKRRPKYDLAITLTRMTGSDLVMLTKDTLQSVLGIRNKMDIKYLMRCIDALRDEMTDRDFAKRDAVAEYMAQTKKRKRRWTTKTTGTSSSAARKAGSAAAASGSGTGRRSSNSNSKRKKGSGRKPGRPKGSGKGRGRSKRKKQATTAGSSSSKKKMKKMKKMQEIELPPTASLPLENAATHGMMQGMQGSGSGMLPMAGGSDVTAMAEGSLHGDGGMMAAAAGMYAHQPFHQAFHPNFYNAYNMAGGFQQPYVGGMPGAGMPMTATHLGCVGLSEQASAVGSHPKVESTQMAADGSGDVVMAKTSAEQSPAATRSVESTPLLDEHGIAVQCAVCGRTGDVQRCSNCKRAYYCCREHQVQNWKDHADFCRQMKAADSAQTGH